MSDITDRMQEAARALEVILPPHTGFALLCFDRGDKPGRMDYCSNGVRADVIKAMKEFIEKADNPATWGKHI